MLLSPSPRDFDAASASIVAALLPATVATPLLNNSLSFPCFARDRLSAISGRLCRLACHDEFQHVYLVDAASCRCQTALFAVASRRHQLGKNLIFAAFHHITIAPRIASSTADTESILHAASSTERNALPLSA